MKSASNERELERLFPGAGEMARLMRALDWSKTPLGLPATWPQSLRVALSVCLNSRFPMFVWWGNELTNFYNDAYVPVLGRRHPVALGRPARETWSDIWDTVGPQSEAVLREGRASWNDDVLLIMERNGYPEETYFTWSYSPITKDDGKVGGVFCACNETTGRVLGERRLSTLRELAARTADARSFDAACTSSAAALDTNPEDTPFALIYLIEPDKRRAVLAGTSRIERGHAAAPESVGLAADSVWPFATVIASQTPYVISDLASRIEGLPTGAWRVPPHHAIAAPIAASGQMGKAGVLIVGLNPFRLFDDSYRGFIDLVSAQIAASIGNAQAHEEERKRAEALAKLDRAKTAFFSNVSHEFRTPLTLMLGPLDELKNEFGRAGSSLSAPQYQQIDLVHRNSQRLLKLVNTLLDFSRIEAGRTQAVYEETDLAAYTADLASVFRSAIERAGLRLIVDCAPLPEAVFVDREMWEKMVLNLLSNAFKFTFEGEIEVKLEAPSRNEIAPPPEKRAARNDTAPSLRGGEADEAIPGYAELTVRDTGVGIPAEQLQKIFERFHRVPGAHGRTYEGSGIGLALVQELARMHGGSISVESVHGKGSTFRVSVPLGKSHLPPTQIAKERTQASTASSAQSYLEEALGWLPETGTRDQASGISAKPFEKVTEPYPPAPGPRPLILLADDNADMREYVARLLRSRYEVETVANGEAALAAIEKRIPDLVLSDVMMPRLDGFGLLERLRANERTKTIPVILLSARAGEEAKVEGLGAGADDYLVKPFSARELVARVETHLKMAALRREAGQAIRETGRRLADALNAADMGTWRADLSTGLSARDANLNRILGHAPIESTQAIDDRFRFVHPDDKSAVNEAWKKAIENRDTYETEFRLLREDGSVRWLRERGRFIAGENATPDFVTGVTRDITERKRTEVLRECQRQALQMLAENAPLHDVLEFLIRTVESQSSPGQLGSIVLLNEAGTQFQLGIGPSLPKAFNQAMKGIEVNPAGGICCHALLGRTAVVVPDFAAEARWEHFAQMVAPYGLRAGWSTPIFGSNGQVLGTFANYYREPRDPTPKDMELVEIVTRTAAIAIERRRAEEAVSETEQRFARYMEHLPGLAWTKDLNGRYLYANEAAKKVFGKAGAHPHGKTDDEIFPPDAAAQFKENDLRALASNAGVQIIETLRHEDGILHHSLVSKFPIRGEDGAPVAIGGMAVDITDLKRAEEALKEADRRKDEFLATLAHELRNPLAPIRNSLHILRMTGGSGHAAERVHEMMERQVNHMVRLVDDLMEVSRITRGQIELRKEHIELASVIRSAIDTAKPLLESAGHVLHLSIPPEPVLLEADPVRLAQVFANLLNNAAKYTKNGGQIWLDAKLEGDGLAVSVRDTGIGIRPEMLPRVFDLFTQASKKGVQGGMGIGLSLVRSLLKLHGGSVEAKSEGEDKGSEFIVRLPIITAPVHEYPRAAGYGARPISPRRILVVDDNRDAADSLGMLLRFTGADAHVVYDGKSALDALETYQPGIVLLDIGMPEMDGIEVARRIRKHPEFKNVTIIALTGWGQEHDRRLTRGAGFDHHLIKPADINALEALLSSLEKRVKSD